MRLFLLASFLTLGIIPFGALASWSRIDPQTIQMDGPIDEYSYQSYLDVSEGGYSKVILKSAGGSPLPALLIAQEMLILNPKILVRDYCLSACANYLLLAGRPPAIPAGAFVSWHGSPSQSASITLERMRQEQNNPKLIATYSDWLERFDAREREFFSTIGINRDLLQDSVAIVQREQILPETIFTFNDMTGDYSETATAAMWVPTTAVMRGYGIDTRNFHQNYDDEIEATLKKLGFGSPYTSAGP